MNKKHFLSVMLVCLLAFGLMFAGCSDGGSNTTKTTTPTVPTTQGQLTIEGLSSYNGKYVVAMYEEDIALWASETFSNSSVKAGTVSGGKVTLNVWEYDEDFKITAYTGNDKDVEFDVLILSKADVDDGLEENLIAYGTVKISFTDGNGSGTFELELEVE